MKSNDALAFFVEAMLTLLILSLLVLVVTMFVRMLSPSVGGTIRSSTLAAGTGSFFDTRSSN